MSRLGDMHIKNHTGDKHTATIIYFHGLGSSGWEMMDAVHSLVDFSFPHIKVLYPTAPEQRCTAVRGVKTKLWFDSEAISPDVAENLESIAGIENEVKTLIEKENEAGIPSNRIIVGGYSMGGALAFHTGYRWDRNLAGVFVFSSFLNNKSVVYEELKNDTESKKPHLLHVHGDIDQTVDVAWGQATFEQLRLLGVRGDFCELYGLGHCLDKHGMELIKRFIEIHLPEI